MNKRKLSTTVNEENNVKRKKEKKAFPFLQLYHIKNRHFFMGEMHNLSATLHSKQTSMLHYKKDYCFNIDFRDEICGFALMNCFDCFYVDFFVEKIYSLCGKYRRFYTKKIVHDYPLFKSYYSGLYDNKYFYDMDMVNFFEPFATAENNQRESVGRSVSKYT